MQLTSYFCIISTGRTKRNIHGSEERNPQNPRRQIYSAHLANRIQKAQENPQNPKTQDRLTEEKCTKQKINP